MAFFDAIRERSLYKLAAVLLILSLLIVLTSFIAGLISGDVRGQLAFGLLVGCFVLTASVPMVLRAPLLILRVIQVSWLAMAVFVLAVGLVFGGDAGDTVLTYAMVALSFPCSLLAAPLAGGFLGGLTKEPGGLVMLWLALFCVGYVQWFVLLKFLLRSKRANH